ncbi:hypothetical protein GUJ93_ZPchr0006g44516 [Zizania palustris]|uniref:DUF4220 domain-containing protein n=1 Tax=Zizania palustris TaxID=103762 RepID=A0A8J5VT78_ZIZPA|nr:hypothetical protein GUJ93_ZPchr0006g44516 [Zizania palustris]
MLLVELLRKKVYAMVAPAPDTFARGVGRYSLFDAVEEAARMVWIGYLIYSYVHGFGVKSFFIILWIFSIAKLCKRAVCIHLAKDSFDLAKNATLVSGYMAQLVGAQRQLRQPVDDGDCRRGDSVMKACNYVVMGESQLKKKETPHGIEIDDDDIEHILDDVESSTNTSSRAPCSPKHLVRVSTIWGLAESDKMFQDDERRRQKMKNICLALALFKLLRRRMERCHMAETNTPQARAIVLQGLLALGGNADADAERAFEVVEMELRFLEEYYQAIIPLALPKPSIFIANFAFSIAFILLYCITVLLVTGNGDIFRVLGNLFQGLAGLSVDMVVQFECFRHQMSFLFNMVCSSCDLIITFLLTLTLLAIEMYEFAQYLLSDWFAASILCNYARKPHLQEHRHARRAVKSALWVRHRSHPVIKVNQITILKLHQMHPRRLWVLVSRMLKRRLVGLHPAVVTTEAKVAIVTALRTILSSGGDYCGGDYQFSNCMDV